MSSDDMDMDMGGMNMGSMDMGSSSVYYQQIYWACVGAVIGAFFLVNAYSHYLAWQRRRSTSTTPAKPATAFTKAVAAVTATVREISITPMGWMTIKGRAVAGPAVGKVILVLINIAVLLKLSFHGFNLKDTWSFEDIGYRLGRITVCQLPLLFLLAGKRNLIGLVTGFSYERINWLHRWAARSMLLIATLHMGYWFTDWDRYKYISAKVASDALTQRGLAAWGILVWITFSSMTPIRGWAYEFFVIQHIVSFTAFVVMIYYHVPAEVRIYVWISVAVFFLDRFLRAASYLFNNLLKFHAVPSASGGHRDLWGSRAEFTPLAGGCTKITIRDPPCKWQPGQHVFLTCHSLAPLQAHPFTISSIPSDGKMEFVVQARAGGTKRFQGHAKRLPETTSDLRAPKHVAIEGPYGHVRPLQQFDSIVLFAGSTGATFTTPLMRNVVHSWTAGERTVTRRIKFVWVVKSGNQLDWFRDQLSQVVENVKQLQASGHDLAVSISLYVTCNDAFTSQHTDWLSTMRKSMQNERQPQSAPCTAPVTEAQVDEKRGTTVITVEEKVDSPTPPASGHKNCCCRGSIDENSPDAPLCTCSCCGIEPVSDSSSSSSANSITDIKGPIEKVSEVRNSVSSSREGIAPPLLHPEIQLYSGRPKIRDVTRTVLEGALGESAVIACGPQGLIDDVRLATVKLSDERAVNRGTGAQGIWLHTEAFGY